MVTCHHQSVLKVPTFLVLSFREGSVVVDFIVILEALKHSKTGLYNGLKATLTDAIADGNLGFLKVQPDSLSLSGKCNICLKNVIE